MKFASIQLQGFKKYLDQTFEFGDGLTIVVGPNEAGKTTLHQALVTALYGFGSKSAQLLRGKEEARNWSGHSRCEVSLRFSIKDAQYSITRDLDQGKITLRLLDHDKGREVILSEDAKRIHELIADLIYIPSPDVFNQTISVKQNQMAQLTDLASVGEAIEAIFTGEEKVSIEHVLENLQKLRKSLKRKPREKPGRIDELMETLETKERALAEALAWEKEGQALYDQVAELRISVPARKARLTQLKELTDRTRDKTAKQLELETLRKRYSELSSELKKIEHQQSQKVEADEKWQPFEKIVQHEKSIDEFRHAVHYLKTTRERIAKEEERLSAERRERMVIVHNTNIFLSPKALLAGIALAIFGIVGAFVTSYWPLFALSFIGMIWVVVNILKGGGRQLKVTDVPSELLAQLRREEKEQSGTAEHDAGLFGLGSEMIASPQDVDAYFSNYYQCREAWTKATAALDAVTANVDLAAMQKELTQVEFDGGVAKTAMEAFSGFNPSSEETAAWDRELTALAVNIPADEGQLNHAEGRLKQMQQHGASSAQLSNECDYLKNEIHELEVKHTACEIAISTLDEVVSQFRAEFLPELESASSHYLKDLTNGYYNRVELVHTWPNVYLDVKEDVRAEQDQLSQGTMDQLFFALRLAAADLMSKHIALPLILDDPFVHFDDERYAQAITLMGRAAQQRQVLYFTSRRHIHEDLKNFVEHHAGVQVIELKR
ncbi:hypothetical protein AUK40_04040 [Candidatus Wirthbacteria bacterium CG2_30_54_11]|uniref:Rad50/SbcC-type AAA domain-containing protein n=1 Tax=Candidatus Wirthbacteria bacterium CG2_30_54_11 TaxID=1817892 RepID=A0A1J5IJ26_9BACT|nr:MAG: hypothetical protein AUK40_04040 [Candidatus Wirthbacteria bacterium CG2_30_54_11]